ncbi:LacI family DNA-binding transcriptional regulator [Rariglobus hedericola]|uniref:LacI family transcriptional regulator n=1 Tax=Rariglobus hedericola TaxID=2597822 RepID=A0A556QSQ5_9BACT|nr:LacI family DNA-binding transcriptional regulator [Rariglobus hedericola]TSJ79653.1 LacI family transcriptional regulator [Rariglobus hedericola]
MATPGYVRQQDIALKAGVHITTVSLALRDDPRLAETTRRRIQDLAMEMGYTPDPMLSALTVYRNRSKRIHHQGTLAWLCPPTIKSHGPQGFAHYLKGAEERATELGYKLEVFYFSELGGSRLSSVLRARNIKGLLIPPQAHSRAHLDFDWNEFSSVCFGFTLSWPRLHLITNAQYSSSRLAVRMLRTRGYHRLGFVTTRETDERTDQNFRAGFLSEQHDFLPENRIPPLVLEDTTIATECKEFAAWYRRHKPDVILYIYPTVAEFLRLLKITPKQCGSASLSVTALDGSLAGVYQNDLLIGHKAVDFLIDMLHRNERGIPPKRFQFFVESEWVEGKSIRPAVV